LRRYEVNYNVTQVIGCALPIAAKPNAQK